MKISRNFITVIVAFAFFISAFSYAFAAKTIIPGRQLGPIVLGKPVSPEAMRILGKPTSYSAPDKGANGKDTGSYYWQNIELIVKLNDGKADKNVYQASIGAPGYSTEKGIQVGSSFKQVKSLYPAGKKIEAMDMDFGWEVPGMTFGIYQGKVSRIGVYPTK